MPLRSTLTIAGFKIGEFTIQISLE